MSNLQASGGQRRHSRLFPQIIHDLLPLILVWLLASGCALFKLTGVTKSDLMNDPQICSLREKMSVDEAVAILNRHSDWGARNEYELCFYTADRSGFKYYHGQTTDVSVLRVDIITSISKTPVPEKDIAFADVKTISYTASLLRVYCLSTDAHPLFWTYNPPQSERKRFLAAVSLLCPNLR